MEGALAKIAPVSRESLADLVTYANLLAQWQKRINLVAPSTVTDMEHRHFADCLQVHQLIPNARHVIDLGSGAGFPGLVLAILMANNLEESRVDLIESSSKKCAFLRTVARELDLAAKGCAVHVHAKRIEDVLPDLPTSDAITARALASLSDLLTMSGDRISGPCQAIFAKGVQHQSEIAQARKTFNFDVELEPSRLETGSVLLRVTKVRPL